MEVFALALKYPRGVGQRKVSCASFIVKTAGVKTFFFRAERGRTVFAAVRTISVPSSRTASSQRAGFRSVRVSTESVNDYSHCHLEMPLKRVALKRGERCSF
jgi:hypothetical protein